jgi:hypothetical protein
MAAEWLTIVGLPLVVVIAGKFAVGVLIPWLTTIEWQQAAARLNPRSGQQAVPPRRSIERLARDLRRLGPRFHQPPPGTSRVKIEAARYAYDRVLGEAATAVGVEHLLSVLPPGDDLDSERTRVESRLWLAGVRFEEAA